MSAKEFLAYFGVALVIVGGCWLYFGPPSPKERASEYDEVVKRHRADLEARKDPRLREAGRLMKGFSGAIESFQRDRARHFAALKSGDLAKIRALHVPKIARTITHVTARSMAERLAATKIDDLKNSFEQSRGGPVVVNVSLDRSLVATLHATDDGTWLATRPWFAPDNR